MTSLLTERSDKSKDEERKPAADEGTSYDSQGSRSLPLPFLFHSLLGPFLLALRRRLPLSIQVMLRQVKEAAAEISPGRQRRLNQVTLPGG